jgi:peptide deformylase
MSEKAVQPHLELISPRSNVLNERADVIPQEQITSPETQWLIVEMLAVANGTQGDTKKRTMVGLAAPQVGVGKRIIVVDVAGTGMGEEPDLRVYVNPIIIKRSPKTEIGREGCFSTGNVCGIVDRASEITVEAFDRNGTAVKEDYEGFTARILQHERDHLDGIRFPDLISDNSRLHWVEPEQFGDYREHWRDWAAHCSRETWQEIKAP